ncbi:DUF4383 domain-containing protein [Lacisediminihabitans changchengi]|uniref:DUF4383 domain-containing protein n=1 Tax=Lacisediminihabitans changchengi TaxID=2787634 RepID=A0A934SNK0_9MICO|nr:DUF4383 domain-containing protein [Lacisediminihabitans changchengi]MBK4348701.1 DUF4383 domain-containing protein [Lacisediminihabitans changchengi]
MLAVVLGALYVVLGALGFASTGGVGFFSTQGGLLLGIFEVNDFHNIAHLVIGAALVMAGLSGRAAALMLNRIVGTLYLLIGLAGLYVVGTPLNVLALNLQDHVLHFASAILLLAASLGTEQPAGPRRG